MFLATRNTGKLAEMQRILSRHVPGVEVLGLDDVPPYDEPAETEPTFEGNARIKALAGLAATGLPSLADDSGLAVDALNGMPGVLSARWAGVSGERVEKDRANNDLLLSQLADVPDERRGAAFHCCVVLAVPSASGEPAVHAVDGVMRGRVIRSLRGTGGFGYDVLFCADGHDVTTAELPPEEKDAISHRGKALREIAPVVAAVLSSGPDA
ncbi:RdgB/HAM1 family non-canonical purine NTP pyrophosphatase [Nocardioides marmoribigeumensis]